MLVLAAILALAGALVYGSADFLGGLGARRLRSIVVTAVAAATGVALLLVLYPFVGGRWTATDAAWGVLAGIVGLIAVALLYACLAIGPMSILSPLTAIVSAVAPMLWGLFVDEETMSPSGYAGLGLALVAVVLVGFVPGERTVRPRVQGVVLAVGSGVSIGAFLVIIDQTSADSGLVPLLVSRVTSTVVTLAVVAILVAGALRRGAPAASVLAVSPPEVGIMPSGHADLEHAGTTAVLPAVSLRAAWLLALGCGVLDASANAMLLVALRLGDLAVVGALQALYPAGTILLAAVVLRERIAAVQWAGLVLALTAGGLLAVA